MLVRKTHEQHHDELIAAITYELDTYGPASLADVITTLIDDRANALRHETHDLHAAKEWERVAWAFKMIAHAGWPLPVDGVR